MTPPLPSRKPVLRRGKPLTADEHVRVLAPLSRRALAHELQVHQVELEQQNEELLRTQGDLAAARDRFVDLFDFAPVSYLTLDRDGRIVEANLTAATEFATDRQSLLGQNFVHFIAPADGDRWQRLVASAFRRGDARRIELELQRGDGRLFHAQLDCHRVMRPGAKAQLRLTLTDVSLRQLAEKNRRIATTKSQAHESERRVVAHQLHEDLGQRLGALRMRLGSWALSAESAPTRAMLDAMTGEVDQALALVRRMSTELHPLILDNLGLRAALDWLVRDVSARLGLAVELHLDDAVDLVDGALAIDVYRLTELALDHFARQVDAGISIELLGRPRDLVLQFQSLPGHARHGAAASEPTMDMPEPFSDQVHLLGGRLEVDELPGGIRRVSVFMPRPATVPKRRAPANGTP